MTTLRLLALCGLLAACAGDLTDAPGGGSPDLARAAADPTVGTVAPDNAPRDTTLDVQVLGTGYDQGSRVDLALAGVLDPTNVRTNSTRYVSSKELVANITISLAATLARYDVVVTTSKGKKGIGTERFLVFTEVLAAPSGGATVSDVSPTALISGSISTSCGPGFAPALWDQAGQLTQLPALAGTCGGVARAVNSGGTSVGSAYVGSSMAASVRWTPGSGGYAVDQLPLLPDGTEPGAWDINDLGQVGGGNAAAVWTQATGWQLLIKPVGATLCVATQINNSGQMTARCTIGGQPRGAFWATVSADPVLLPLPTGATGTSPWGINASGTIAGYIQSGGVNRAARWVPAGATWTPEILGDLGSGGSAHGLNDAGQVIGAVNATSGGYVRPAYWEPSGALHLLESSTLLGEAVGVSQVSGGLVIAGYVRTKGTKVAVRWRP
ncbi:MAG: hypothetical protein ABIQ49_07625 [Gemmatimonadales bacterium]